MCLSSIIISLMYRLISFYLIINASNLLMTPFYLKVILPCYQSQIASLPVEIR